MVPRSDSSLCRLSAVDKKVFAISALAWILVIGCGSFHIKEGTGFRITNRSSFDIKIEALRRIRFVDTSGRPWKRKYTYHIRDDNPLRVIPGETRKVALKNGYYGIEFCNPVLCYYKTFHFRERGTLVIEDTADGKSTQHRFDEW